MKNIDELRTFVSKLPDYALCVVVNEGLCVIWDRDDGTKGKVAITWDQVEDHWEEILNAVSLKQ